MPNSSRKPRPGAIAPSTHCNARTRGDKLCRNVAGFRTGHVGAGRCYLHGGKSPIKSGRYSGIKRESLRDLIAQHEADPDPLNILPELAAARALFQDFIERYDVWADALGAWHASYSEEYDKEIRFRHANHDATTCPFLGPDPLEVFAGKPVQILDVADAYRIVSEITKIVERIEKVRAANAVSRPEMIRIMTEMGRIVALHVSDPTVTEAIQRDWVSIIRVG
jgi:hypothetical protein